jgi:hypothetical protein
MAHLEKQQGRRVSALDPSVRAPQGGRHWRALTRSLLSSANIRRAKLRVEAFMLEVYRDSDASSASGWDKNV